MSYLKFPNYLLILTFILSIPCQGFLVKVNLDDPKSMKVTLTSDPPREIIFSYYTLEVNGEIRTRLEDKSSPQIQEGDKVEFDLGTNKIQLPEEMGERLAKVLSSGIEGKIFHLLYHLAYKTSSHVDSEPCSLVMFYLAFGITDFIKPPVESSEKLLSEEGTLSDLKPSLQPFSVISMESKVDPADKNTVIYLGSGLFLCWEHYSTSFYIRSAEFLDESHNDAGHRYVWHKNVVGDDSPSTDAQYLAALIQMHLLTNGGYPTQSAVGVDSYSYIK